jgi:hypothetical protein
MQRSDNAAAQWLVLLIGGPSGIGKTTIAAQVARRLDVPWLMVDDLRLALMRSGLAIPDNPHAEAFDPADGLITIGKAVTPAIEVVIENHVDQRIPVVIEGDGILPELFDRDSVRARATNGRIRSVYLIEPTPTPSTPTLSPAAPTAGATICAGTSAEAPSTESGLPEKLNSAASPPYRRVRGTPS